jgi:hypothetical protein
MDLISPIESRSHGSVLSPSLGQRKTKAEGGGSMAGTRENSNLR